MKINKNMLVLSMAMALGVSSAAIAKSDSTPLKAGDYSAFKWREMGPGLTSGRIADFAFNPANPSEYYVAVASGGVWKTTNAGTTFAPIFDGQSTFSIGDVTLDPNNSNTVWVGSGENNSQRSVGYGDGVYKSIDGGQSWSHMGLKNSEHIAKILIDPRDSDTVFVASQGPLWNKGGDRGLFKSIDGGKTWKATLAISEHTGVTDVVMHPTNPDIMYAASYQRRRHVWTLINGGPESTIYKSTDGGDTWRKVNAGLPGGDLGRIGLAIAPSNADIVYAIVEATAGKSGFYRSTNQGESWHRQGKYVTGSPQYYQEIVVDPKNENRIYALDTYMMVSEDGGANFSKLGEKNKHVDNHAMWINPNNTNHLVVGSDGGIYESYDRGQFWDFKPNLPITQFYRVSVDNDAPFYSVYGGTQDNFSLGAPTRSIYTHGISNSDWIITQLGDGFKTVVDPLEPNIIYSQAQYGWLSRIDKKSRDNLPITPVHPDPNQVMRWNWNSPLAVSHHKNTRLYYASQVLFKTDDRGDNWQPISGDLTRNVDRNKLKVMDKVWSIDAVAKNKSTSSYGSIVSFSESPLNDQLLYTGSDDGLLKRTKNGGQSWKTMDWPSKVPDMTYVSDLEASLHDQNVVFASFDNHKKGDYKPYIYMSDDQGKSWDSITGDLPKKGTVYTIAQDHVNANLLFAGTEFGIFFSQNKGENWIQLKGGLPTIAVRDIDIQRRESDLAIATFGRGIYILDNYAPLRVPAKKVVKSAATLFQVKDALQFVTVNPLGYEDGGHLGAGFYAAKNPTYGAIFNYYLKDGFKSLKSKRQAKDAKATKAGKAAYYPSWDALQKEKNEIADSIELHVKDANGQIVRKLSGSNSKGFQQVAWDLRHPAYGKAIKGASGPMVMPGQYSVSLIQISNGKAVQLGESQSFQVKSLNNMTLASPDRASDLSFEHQVGQLVSYKVAAENALDVIASKLVAYEAAIQQSNTLGVDALSNVQQMKQQHTALMQMLNGESIKRKYNEPGLGGINGWLGSLYWGRSGTKSMVTGDQKRMYQFASDALKKLYPKVKSLMQSVDAMDARLNGVQAPWTEGRLPEWK
jgi:photosystem II stability/assembly factor-like uncharacterized protein